MWKGSWDGLREGLFELLAPPTCVGCDLNTPSSELRGGFCDACGPLLEKVLPGSRPPAPSAALYVHGGPMADAIRRMKYAGRSEICSALGAHLASAARHYSGMIDVVVPVPSHPRRLAERGYEPSALLAVHVARELGVPLEFSLRRHRSTPPQASLARAERLGNVRGAFVAVGRIRGRRILLIDDVRTTGATLSEGVTVLRSAGAADVRTLALASAEGAP